MVTSKIVAGPKKIVQGATSSANRRLSAYDELAAFLSDASPRSSVVSVEPTPTYAVIPIEPPAEAIVHVASAPPGVKMVCVDLTDEAKQILTPELFQVALNEEMRELEEIAGPQICGGRQQNPAAAELEAYLLLQDDAVVKSHASSSLPKASKAKTKAKAEAKTKANASATPRSSTKQCEKSSNKGKDSGRGNAQGRGESLKSSLVKRMTSNAYKQAFKAALKAGNSKEKAYAKARAAYAKVAQSHKNQKQSLKEV